MKTKTLLGFFLLSLMTFCISACQDDAEIILFSGSELIDETGTCTNTISSTVLYLNGWESENIGIANGKGGYSAQSSDETIVTATVNDNRLWLSSHGKKGKVTVTRPDDVYRLSEEGEGGKFTYKTQDEQILAEGTYRIEWASLAGKQKKAFVFTYKGENDVEKQHTFFNFSPYLGTQSLTRERGPITTAWLEDVSDSPYLEDVLPADRTVVYWVDTMIFSLSAEDL